MFDREAPRPHPLVHVVMTTLTAADVTLETLESWDNLRQYDVVGRDGKGGCQHVLGGGRIQLTSGPRVAEGRTQIVEAVLKAPELGHVQWVLCVDADMTFPSDALCRLLGQAYDGNPKADPDDPACPVIGGLCFAGGYERMYPTIYELKPSARTESPVPEPVKDYPANALVKVGATGAAFLLVHRKVLEAMLAPHPHGFGTDAAGNLNPHPWFSEVATQGVQFGEDVTFCMRAQALGFGVYVDTGVHVGHVKKMILDEAKYADYRARVEAREERSRAALRELGADLLLPPPVEV